MPFKLWNARARCNPRLLLCLRSRQVEPDGHAAALVTPRGGAHLGVTVPESALQQLQELLVREKDRIVRQWAKRVRAESYEVALPRKDVRAPLDEMIDALVRLLEERGEDALRLWPEWVRAHGARRYDQRFEAEDLAREFKALQQVLLHAFSRHHGGVIDEGVADLIAELTGEATASTQASFVRVVRTEEVRFREAAVMESILHRVEVGIMVAELDGTLSFATPPAARLIGIPVRSLVGGKVGALLQPVLHQLHARFPDGRPFRAADLPLMRALRERMPVRGTSMLIDRPDGQRMMIELSATPLWEEGTGGEMVGVIQTLSDRTENAQKTQELLGAYEELRRLQGRLLQRTRTQALGQLASGAAHALNNFLNVIRLRITLMRREFKPEHLDALDRVVRNIGELVARLQEFSVTRTQEILSDVPMDQVVAEALELARSELERPEARIDVETALKTQGRVCVDSGFFRELIVNLMLAARDRMPGNGTLKLSSTEEGAWMGLRIEDSGPRYSEEDLLRLFDPLKGKSQAPQLSLLLAVARNQVQRWGGELNCLNGASPTGGAVFVLRLPRVEAAPLAAPEPPVEQVPSPRRFQRTRRVLVVDDEPENARMLAEVLSDEGYEVGVAHGSAMALQLWERGHFDAALLDALMPGDVTGWRLAFELRHRSPHALLAMVTGMDVRGQNRNNLALVDAVFRKPIDVNALDDFLSRSGEPAPEDDPPEGALSEGALPEDTAPEDAASEDASPGPAGGPPSLPG